MIGANIVTSTAAAPRQATPDRRLDSRADKEGFDNALHENRPGALHEKRNHETHDRASLKTDEVAGEEADSSPAAWRTEIAESGTGLPIAWLRERETAELVSFLQTGVEPANDRKAEGHPAHEERQDDRFGKARLASAASEMKDRSLVSEFGKGQAVPALAKELRLHHEMFPLRAPRSSSGENNGSGALQLQASGQDERAGTAAKGEDRLNPWDKASRASADILGVPGENVNSGAGSVIPWSIGHGLLPADSLLPNQSPAQQITQRIQDTLRNHGAEDEDVPSGNIIRSLRIVLKPEHLGTVEVTLVLQGDRLNIRLSAALEETAIRLQQDSRQLERLVEQIAGPGQTAVVTFESHGDAPVHDWDGGDPYHDGMGKPGSGPRDPSSREETPIPDKDQAPRGTAVGVSRHEGGVPMGSDRAGVIVV